ncbi:MAG: leucine-rich repeat domain-containing protein, partial [Bacteroidota bacterium]
YAALPAHMFNSNLIPFDTIPDLQKVIVTNGELTSQGFDNIRKAYRSLTYVDLYNSSNTVLPDFALENCYLIDTLFLPQHLEEIGFKSVAECAYLEEIAIPLSVTKIGDSAFKNCTSLDSLSFADPYLKSDESLLECIGNWAFYNCHALESLTVPEGVTEIGDGAFYGCTYVDQLNLPSSLLKIGDNAFAKCDHLKNITIHASTPPTIEARTFFDVNREIPVSVPEHSVESYSESVFWGEFVNYKASSVTTDISGIGVKDGVIIKNNNGILEITNPHNYPVEFFDITGQKISVDKVSQGVFIIRIGNTIQKIVL